MIQETIVSEDKDKYLDTCRIVNKSISESIRRASSINPRTKIAGYTKNFFYVDISTGNIFVVPIESVDVLEGYLLHENGHRSFFPASTSCSMAFISAVALNVPWASRQEVVSATNVVADVFSDSMLLRLGFGKTLSKRVQDFINRVKSLDALMCFKVMMYKAVEIASKENDTLIRQKHLDESFKELVSLFPSNQVIISKVYEIARKFVYKLGSVFAYDTPTDIGKVFLNPFKASNAPQLEFLVKTAVKLLHINKELSLNQSSHENNQQEDQQNNNSLQNTSSQRIGTGFEDDSVEGIDIEPSEVSVTDIHKSIWLMNNVFGVDVEKTGIAISMVFSEKIKKTVEKFIEKIKILYIQNDKRYTSFSGFRKEITDLWIHQMGEPDEDSILKEKHKLLWKVEYKEPHLKGNTMIAPSGVPQKVVIVMDESGSTFDAFEDINVLSIEALISMLSLAGIRYRGGGKEISVLKFSNDVVKVYIGSDIVKSCMHILLPHNQVGGGTNIIKAVDVGINESTKNSALIIVTDLEIDPDVADKIGRKLRTAIDSGRVGFVVFVIVNQRKDNSSLDIIKKYLSSQKSIVAHVSNADDLENLGNTLISRILRMR
ncbi:MAG: hypothetical protein QW607_08380 [Desulfurococcaceae archaeon]